MSAGRENEALFALALPDLEAGVRSSLLEAAETLEVPAGGSIIVEGEKADALYLVVAGTAQLSVHQRQHDLAVATVGPGELLGWSWLVPPHRWDFDANSLRGATLLRVPAEVLESVMAAQPDAAVALATTMVAVVSRRLRDTRIQLLDLYARVGFEGQS